MILLLSVQRFVSETTYLAGFEISLIFVSFSAVSYSQEFSRILKNPNKAVSEKGKAPTFDLLIYTSGVNPSYSSRLWV
jgi:hypothetical protein